MQTALLEMILEDSNLRPRDARIMALWEIGRSYTEITIEIGGISREAVAGVVYRNRTDRKPKPKPISESFSCEGMGELPTLREKLVKALHGDTNVYYR